ncbi:MAG: glycosyltransferase [Sphingobacteriaceae bacterium]|nr:glycosyltransferase [Sphingobacteriaceae bacterium]
MKVLQVNSVCGVGSTGRIITDMHDYLLNLGVDCHIAYGRGEAINCDESIRIGSEIDNYFHVFMTRIFDNHGLGSSSATRKFINQIKEIDPDIIHLHNIHGYYINMKLLFEYLRLSGKKIFWTLHDCWSFTGHCSHFDFINCEKWKVLCQSCPQSKQYPASYIADNSKNNYLFKKDIFTNIPNLTLITPSNWLADLVKQSYLGGYPVEVIPNGIDLNVFRNRESDFRIKYNLLDKFIILGVASPWSSRKGFADFLELAKLLPSNYHIVMVGINSTQVKCLPKNITGIFRTDNTIELAEIYSTSNIFFNPTYEDNYPTVNLEAIACNLPVITYNTGGSPEIIDENCGYVVTKKDFNDVISKINLIRLTGKHDLSYRKDEINKDTFIKRVIKLYKL